MCVNDKEEELCECPFCHEPDFDLIGLKSHLMNDCEKFRDTRVVPTLMADHFSTYHS